MDNALLGVLIGGGITLLGTITVSLINGFYNRSNINLQLEEQNRNMRISKMELLYEKLIEYQMIGQDFYLEIGELTTRKFDLKFYDESCRKFAKPLPQIITLLNIYARDLSPLTKNMMKAAQDFQAVVDGVISKKYPLNDLEKAKNYFMNNCQNLLNVIELKADKNISNLIVKPDNPEIYK